MDLAALERSLRPLGTVVVDPRLLRRLIRAHRKLGGLGVQVPHERCYAVARVELLALGDAAELGCEPGELAEAVLLVARPSPRELRGRSETEVKARLWRASFHARVHVEMERLARAGRLDDARIRQRIDRLGQTEFDEIRAILRRDDLLLPPATDREAYVEFAALYLELRHFAPALLLTTFPGLGDCEPVDALVAADLDAAVLLAATRPEGAEEPPAALPGRTSAPTFSAPAVLPALETTRPPPVSPRRFARLLSRAARARARGNDVRAALLCSAAAATGEPQRQREAEAGARADLERLGARLRAALRPPGQAPGDPASPAWTSLCAALGTEAAQRGALRLSVEARLLYGLQRAALAHERPQRAVDLVDWALSRGRRSVVRELAAVRELRVARLLREASLQGRHVRIPAAERKLLARLLEWACVRADENARAALRPRLRDVLATAGLEPRAAAERLAGDKVVEELLDHVLARGFLTLGAVRDAISRNELKMGDLASGRELWAGDALLRADRELGLALDGIYRRGEIYLRGLQKLSSLPFGTRLGRLLSLYLVLPLGGAFVVLEGVGHIVSPVLGWLGLGPLRPLSWTSFVVTAALILGLLRSAALRTAARELLDLSGLGLSVVLFRLPRALFGLPLVRRVLASPAVRAVLRRVVLPVALAAAACAATPLAAQDLWLLGAAALAIFAASSLVMGSRLGAWLEELLVEQLAPAWWTVRRQLLPSLFRLTSALFAALLDLVERGIYRVDELLRFRQGESRLLVGLRAVVGLLWFVVAYVVRLYVTLLVEPEINPLKHFPVVTVAHKLLLPFTPGLLEIGEAALSPLGPIAAGAIAGVTVFLLPSIFGFLAWELGANWRLYRASRPEKLGPARIGPHGETMRGLLVPGLHSGALPKLYDRLRRAAQREDELALLPSPLRRQPSAGPAGSLGRFREGIRRVEQSVRRFVERELGALLDGSARWTHGPIRVTGVDLSSNRVRVRLGCAALGPQECEIGFDAQSGFLVAGIAKPGFVAALPPSGESALLCENALAGLYQRAEVDFVREQIRHEIGPVAHYDIADEGMVVWPGPDFRTELVYRLAGKAGATVVPLVRGDAPPHEPWPLDTRRILFREQAIAWTAWVAAWAAAGLPGAPLPRLLRGAPIVARDRGSETT
ncbi:MAG: hypothetical protein HY744_11175 [Deltaproteobacteria bacterium]|nr:hypothetical protein [Deltaproteobacteria bacterium]